MKSASLGLLLPLWLVACQPAPAPAVPPAATATAPTPEPGPPTAQPTPTPASEPVATPATKAVIPSFRCRGNEPFWALDLGPASGLLKTPETELALDGETRAHAGGTYAFTGSPAGGTGESVSALMVPAQCFDSMADGPALPYNIQISLPDGQVADGCCSVVGDAAR